MTDLELAAFQKCAGIMALRPILRAAPKLGKWFEELQNFKKFMKPMSASATPKSGGAFMSTIFPLGVMGLSAKSAIGDVSKGVGRIGPARNIPYTGEMAPLFYK
jgi:hypothetical protein